MPARQAARECPAWRSRWACAMSYGIVVRAGIQHEPGVIRALVAAESQSTPAGEAVRHTHGVGASENDQESRLRAARLSQPVASPTNGRPRLVGDPSREHFNAGCRAACPVERCLIVPRSRESKASRPSRRRAALVCFARRSSRVLPPVPAVAALPRPRRSWRRRRSKCCRRSRRPSNG